MSASTFPRWANDSQSDFVLRQAQAIQQNERISLKALCPADPNAERSEELGGVRVDRYRYFLPSSLQRVAYPAIAPNLKTNPLLWVQVPCLISALLLRLLKELWSYRPDLLYAHWTVPQGVAVAAASRLTGTPAVLTCHSSDLPRLSNIPLIGRALARWTLKSFSEVTCVNSSIKNLATALCPEDKDKHHLLPMGFDDALTEQSPPRGTKVILFIGRLVRIKGLAEALVALSSIQSNWKLLVAGTGDQEQSLQTLTLELGIQKQVSFLGDVRGEEKLKLFSQAGFLLLPSIEERGGIKEGLPISLLEGMAAGLVCLASRESNATEVITDGESGFLFSSSNTEEMKDAIEKAINSSAEGQSVIGERARASVEELSWSKLGKRYEAILESALSSSRSKGANG